MISLMGVNEDWKDISALAAAFVRFFLNSSFQCIDFPWFFSILFLILLCKVLKANIWILRITYTWILSQWMWKDLYDRRLNNSSSGGHTKKNVKQKQERHKVLMSQNHSRHDKYQIDWKKGEKVNNLISLNFLLDKRQRKKVENQSSWELSIAKIVSSLET